MKDWDHQGTEELIFRSLTTMNMGQSQTDGREPHQVYETFYLSLSTNYDVAD